MTCRRTTSLETGWSENLTMQRELIADALNELLALEPDRDKRQLLAGLRQRGFGTLTTTDVNSVLYERRGLFASDGGPPPRGRLAHSIRTHGLARPVVQESYRLPRRYIGAEPRAWQQEALTQWVRNGRRGVVEAVTGTGKTAVGVLAAA